MSTRYDDKRYLPLKLVKAWFLLSLFAVMTSMPVHGQDLGRLFSTPAERTNLDRLRLQNKLGEAAHEEVPPTATVEKTPQLFTHNGFVKRSNGTETTWINQQPSQDQRHLPNIKVRQELRKAPSVSVLLPSGKRQDLKVGQSFDPATGKIREVYEAAPPTPTKKPEPQQDE